MARIRCTVARTMPVIIDFDCAKIEDFKYIEQKRLEALSQAAEIMECDFDDLVVHDSELPALIE